MAYNGVTFPYSPHVYRNAVFTKESSHIQNVICKKEMNNEARYSLSKK